MLTPFGKTSVNVGTVATSKTFSVNIGRGNRPGWGGALQPLSLSLVLFVVLVVCVGSLFRNGAMGESSDRLMDGAGVIFFALAFYYRSSIRFWLIAYLPMSAVLLLAPLVHFESVQGASWAAVVRAAIVPILSLIAGTLMVVTRRTQASALDVQKEMTDLIDHNHHLLRAIDSLGKDMHELQRRIEAFRGKSHVGQEPQGMELSGQKMIQFLPEQQNKKSLVDQRSKISTFVSVADLQEILKEEVELARAQLAARRSAIRLMLALPEDVMIPMLVRGDHASLRRVISACLARAVCSLGSAPGLVRVSLRAGLYSISLSIEDNGRGLSEELTEKMRQRDLFFGASADQGRWLDVIRDWAETAGARLEVHTRLGVGSRIFMEMNRVDSFVTASRSVARGLRQGLSDSNSRHA